MIGGAIGPFPNPVTEKFVITGFVVSIVVTLNDCTAGSAWLFALSIALIVALICWNPIALPVTVFSHT